LRRVRAQFEGLRSAATFTLYLGLFAGVAFGFYWFLQPTVVKNRGLAAYKPPPLTVINYPSSPFVPPASAQVSPPILAASTEHDIAEGSAAGSEKAADTKAADGKAPESTEIAPARERKVARKREREARPRRERVASQRYSGERTFRDWSQPWNNYAYRPPRNSNYAYRSSFSSGYRPWF
jgi:hypothetical protein